MPHKHPSNNVSSDAGGQSIVDSNPGHVEGEVGEDSDQPTRELTLTDRLNRSLLGSFLDRLNQPNSGVPTFPDTDANEAEFPTQSDSQSDFDQQRESTPSITTISDNGNNSDARR